MEFVTKRDKGEGGLKNWQFLRDVIFEWPHTAQGDPTSMAIYALSSLPLLSAISSANVRHVAYADDLSGAGDLESLSI